MTAKGNDQKPVTQACYEAGSHDYTEPVIVKGSWPFREQVAVIFCRRCGGWVSAGWSG
jgi:hypothetical protein